ncbi:hypothetical protein CP8484711_2076, partial [Chlamydia psittaci 84-8471/1]
QQEIQN